MWFIYLLLILAAIYLVFLIAIAASFFPIMFVDWLMQPIGGSPLVGHLLFGMIAGGIVGLSVGLKKIGRNNQAQGLLVGFLIALGIAFIAFLGSLIQ